MRWKNPYRLLALAFAAGMPIGHTALGQDAPQTQTNPDTNPPPQTTVKETVVVSATKGPEDPVNVADPVSVLTGEELRRRNVRTIADALQDVVGLDTGNGSDNGARLGNIGLWGLKEFDALLVMVDGVPVGGPFNPSLSQINVEDIDRIEVVRGPQGTLYGAAAFAGMIQIFTRPPAGPAVQGSFAGGSFNEYRGNLRWTGNLAPGFRLGVFGSIARGDGWQDRTNFDSYRLTVNGSKTWGKTAFNFSLLTYYDKNLFGSPLPVDAGQPLPGFESDRNYAIGGARLDHHVTSLTTNFSTPIGSTLKLENTLGAAMDYQIAVRSFIVASDGTNAGATGTALKPAEYSVYDDVRLVTEFEGAGHHRLVGGAAVTWGRTFGSGTGYDFDLALLPQPIVPALEDVPVGDNRYFRDRRTFLGFYANDQWTPLPALTVSGGLRYDRASETLHVQQQEVGAPAPDVADDERIDDAVSGSLSLMYRFVDRPQGAVNAINLYVSGRSNFKPAAPNLAEAESARILEPERANAGEIGVKTRWFERTLVFDAHYFYMDFKNLVVAVPSPTGQPALTNAGQERFRGEEFELRWLPAALDGVSFAAGYAHHDARFVHFSFFTPDGDLRVVDGKRLELVPRDLWNVSVSYAPRRGPGAFVAVRHQNHRPLNRRNTFYTPSFFEADAGVSWEFGRARLALVGRNLGDSRHYITDSEIGDSQFYVAVPRRLLAELSVHF